MLPTPETSVWSSSCRLIAGRAPADPADERVDVELRVERVAGDVGDLERQVGAALGDHQPAEHPLVGEPQLGAGVPARRPARTGPAGAGRRGRRPAARASARSCRGGRAARRRCRGRARSTCRGGVPRRRGGRSARRRSRSSRAGRGVRAAGAAPRPRSRVAPTTWRSRPARTTSTSGSSGTPVSLAAGQSSADEAMRRAPTPVSSESSPYAVSAAACSASFLERPTPLP